MCVVICRTKYHIEIGAIGNCVDKKNEAKE